VPEEIARERLTFAPQGAMHTMAVYAPERSAAEKLFFYFVTRFQFLSKSTTTS
jgi:hypothetical protein